MPVIPAIGRLRMEGWRFEASLGIQVHKTPSQQKKLDVLACTYHPNSSEKHKIGESWTKMA
jgi:hypothetical protein